MNYKRYFVRKVDIHILSFEFLTGSSIDEPRANQYLDQPLIQIAGWVVGKDKLITEVEIILETLDLPLQTSVGISKPDVAEFPPNIQNSKYIGFSLLI
jgi:hypothetical protein